HGKGKTLMIHQKPVSRSSEFIGKLNAVLFAPSDLELFEAPPKVRRRLMDVEIGKVSPRYMQALSAMMKLLKERNSLLKREHLDNAMLEVLDQQMIEQQLTIIAMRRQFIAKMNESLSRTYSALAEEEAQVSAAYHTITEQTEPDAMREEISRKLLENRDRDRILKTTSSGVHRDDLSFQLNGRDVLSYASQGQRRMIVLAWKLSLIDFIAERLNELPVLLLDDVLSELDQQKRVNLFSLISPEIQTFITTTEIAELLPFLSRKPKIAEIDSGQIRPWKEDMN
ncbi:DNA replication/repair protein RecF, partial [Holdemania filiformis]